MNKQAKREILYTLIILGHVFMFGAWWQSYQRENSFEVLANGNPTYFEPIKLYDDSIKGKILEAFGEDGETMYKIAKCESGLDPTKTNDSNWLWGGKGVDRGLFQINDYYHDYDEDRIYEVDYNIAQAKKVYNSQGLYAWSCYKSGVYLLMK